MIYILLIILIKPMFFAYSVESIDRNDNIQDFGLKCSVLRTPEEHKEAFKYALKTAKKSILITSFGDVCSSFGQYSPYKELFESARSRGVTIYYRWYNKDPKKLFPNLQKSHIKQHGMPIHSKIVMVDENLLLLGSYNWLPDISWHWKKNSVHNLNRSFKIEGQGLSLLRKTIWGAINYHRNKENQNSSKLSKRRNYVYKRTPANQRPHIFNLNATTTLSYLSTVEAHRRELIKWFERAKNRIIIISPYVSAQKFSHDTYKKDFTCDLINSVLQRGVHLVFICSNDKKSRLSPYFDQFANNPYFHLIFKNDIHAKTAIIDSDLITEGSFNWLETARSERFEHYKHEATMICQGTEATKFIDDFDATELGEEIRREISKTQQQSRKKKERPVSHKKTGVDKYQKLNSTQRYQNTDGFDGDLHESTDKKLEDDSLVSLSDARFLSPEYQGSPVSSCSEDEFFVQRKKDVERELWINSPLWKELNAGYFYIRYEKFFEVIKDKFGRGWYVRINKKDRIPEEGQAKYFATSDDAKRAIFDHIKEF